MFRHKGWLARQGVLYGYGRFEAGERYRRARLLADANHCYAQEVCGCFVAGDGGGDDVVEPGSTNFANAVTAR